MGIRFTDTTMTRRRKSPFGANQTEEALLHHETRLLNSIENNTDYTESFKDLTKAYNSYTKRLENRTRTRLTKLQCLNRLQTYNPIDYDTLLGGDPKGSTKEAREEANRFHDYLQSTSWSLATKKSYIKTVKLLSRCMITDPESGKWVEDTERVGEVLKPLSKILMTIY